MVVGIPAAGDIGIQTFNAMGKPHTLEKFKGPINRRGFGGFTPWPEGGDQIIGLQRPVRLEQELQHPSARWSQPRMDILTTGFSLSHSEVQRRTDQPCLADVVMMAIGSHAQGLTFLCPNGNVFDKPTLTDRYVIS